MNSLINRILGLRKEPASRLSRRALLQIGTAAAAGLLSGAKPRLSHARGLRDYRVVVVGGGFSGLACAYELASIGHRVDVLEARGRVGGRVLSLQDLIPGKIVEGGGEMIGSNHSHVLAYAAKFGFEFLDGAHNADCLPIFQGGKRLSDQAVQSILEEVEKAQSKMTDDARVVVNNEPWLTPDAVRLDQRTTAEWIDTLGLSDLAKKLTTLQFTANNGVETDKQSYLGNLAQVKGGGLEKYWTDTEVYRLRGGNQQIAFRLAKELGDERIHLNCPVRSVVVAHDRVTVTDISGRQFEADDVVLAIPPTMWSSIEFSPTLPKTLVPQMGANVKYLSVLNESFWNADRPVSALSLDGDIQSIWHGTQGQEKSGLEALVSFSGGNAAEAIHRREPKMQQSAYVRSLEILFPGFEAAFVNGRLMDWIGDRWTQSSYSFPAPGQVTTIGPQLRRGLGRLHFAGEHTCYQFVGYMEGALHSGATLAMRLANKVGHIEK